MFFIKLLNNYGETFTKRYQSYYFYYQDLIKFRHTNKLRIISNGRVI